MTKIAIVGPEESKWTEEQIPRVKDKIRDILYKHGFVDGNLEGEGDVGWVVVDYRNLILVSGHCPKGGVDVWAEEIANELGIKTEIYAPEVNQWGDELSHQIEVGSGYKPENPSEVRLKGYRSRNIDIAKSCGVLYCIVPRAHPEKVSETEWNEELWCKHCGGFSPHPSNGGCWTMAYANKLGKEVHLVVIE